MIIIQCTDLRCLGLLPAVDEHWLSSHPQTPSKSEVKYEIITIHAVLLLTINTSYFYINEMLTFKYITQSLCFVVS